MVFRKKYLAGANRWFGIKGRTLSSVVTHSLEPHLNLKQYEVFCGKYNLTFIQGYTNNMAVR